MKVWVISMFFPAPREVFMSNDVRYLKDKNIDIQLFSLRKEISISSKLIKERNLEDIERTSNSFINTLRSFKNIAEYPMCFFDLFFFVLKYCWKNPIHILKSLILLPRIIQIFSFAKFERPEIVHLYWSHYPSLLGYLFKKYNPEIKLTMQFVAHDIRIGYGGTLPVAKLADHLVTITKFDMQRLIDLGIQESKIDTIYHGINEKYICDQSLVKDEFRIVSVGALVKDKGMDTVVKSYNLIKKKYPRSKLKLIGDGPFKEELEELIKKLNIPDIEFLGHISHRDVIENLKAAKIFLFLSRKERIPNVAKEAMACRCYCVLSNTTGINELVINNDYGTIVPIDNEEKAYNAVIEVFENSEKYLTTVQKTLNHIKDNFTISRSNDKLINLWQNLLV